MKNIPPLTFLLILSAAVQAQEVIIDTSYYVPPPLIHQRVLMADPDKNPGNHQFKRGQRAANRPGLMNQPREVRTWYISAEGGFRSDGSRLSNSFAGLVSAATLTKATWGLLLGYTYRNTWTIETGYTHAPTHLNLTIANSGTPLVYAYSNSGYGFPVRLKYRLGAAGKALNGTGFWITAGAWITPNGSGQAGKFNLIGYSYRDRRRVDTLRITNTTAVVNRVTGIAELGLDYATRLSSYLELGFYGRKYWGLGNVLKADLIYTVNNSSQQQSTITADGSGWGFGLSLRYIYGRQHEIKKP